MTLARMWRRQLLAASSAALIVPSAMIAALVALALGGGFSQLGVLGQVFSGPPAPSAGALTVGAATARTAGAIPVIPIARTVQSSSGGARTRVRPAVSAPRTGAPSTGLASTGGTIAPGGVKTRPISAATGSGSSQPRPGGGQGTGSSSPSPSPHPSPSPSPRPTPVDTVVKAVTSVTSQIPAPVGSAVTQTVQSAGNAADSLLSNLP